MIEVDLMEYWCHSAMASIALTAAIGFVAWWLIDEFTKL